MEDPEAAYCEVIDSGNDAQPSPAPKPPLTTEENISEFRTSNIFQPRIIPALLTHPVFTSRCTRCDKNSPRIAQMAVTITVALFAILSMLFMVLYFTTVNCKPCDKMKCDPRFLNNSIVSNCSESSEYSTLFPRRSTKDYVISHSQPPMTAITACFWVNANQTEGPGCYVSYATDSSDNDFLIWNQNDVNVWMRGSATTSKKIVINDGKWHSICCLWSNENGEYKIYKDGTLVNSGTNFKKGHTIPGRGTWVLGQDQDSVGGGFEVADAMQGEITEVNVWDKELSYEQIQEFSTRCQCKLRGNIRSWNDFIAGAKGDVKIVKWPTCSNV